MTRKRFIGCAMMELPEEMASEAALVAIEQNPANAPPVGAPVYPNRIAIYTQKYHATKGVDLSVSFLDGGPAELRKLILDHANIWGKRSHIRFRETSKQGHVRITRTPGEGHYSYCGTDIFLIPLDQPTMNLDSFGLDTPESEFLRVVPHEFGHTLGCVHEHLRADLVLRLDVAKTIAFFQRTQGWTERVVRQNVLTPVSERSLMGTPSDQTSIMAYQLPGSITIDGKPIIGGVQVNESDHVFFSKLYPLPPAPPPGPPPPPLSGLGDVSVNPREKVISVGPGWTVRRTE